MPLVLNERVHKIVGDQLVHVIGCRRWLHLPRACWARHFQGRAKTSLTLTILAFVALFGSYDHEFPLGLVSGLAIILGHFLFFLLNMLITTRDHLCLFLTCPAEQWQIEYFSISQNCFKLISNHCRFSRTRQDF